jgi:phosphoesterase RecJ-like protein
MKDKKQILEVLNKEKNFLITSHIRPDGDSIASQLALYYILRKMGKKSSIINQDCPSQNYRFLPFIEEIKTEIDPNAYFPVSIILDCHEWKRIGEVEKIASKSEFIINIDHHPTEKGIGKFNFIDPEISSIGEMIYQIAKEFDLSFDKTLATLIYTAILTDTGSFRFSNTTSSTHKIASDLLSFGIVPSKIYNLVYENNPPGILNLLSLCLSTINFIKDKVAIVQLSKEMLESTKVSYVETELITNLLFSVGSVDVAILLRELEDNKIRINFRSKKDIDVHKIAQLFNGGGHRQASGCVIKGTLESAFKLLSKRLREYLSI